MSTEYRDESGSTPPSSRAGRRIVIIPYSDEWPAAYAEIEREVAAAIGDAATRIDHIGSTSVPGLAAKDVIDLQVSVRSLDIVPGIVEPLSDLGFSARVIASDHIPPGGDPAEYRKAFFSRPADGHRRQVHLHVRELGMANARYPILFRDYLRTHAMAAEAYANAKVALATYDPTDWDLYYDVKDPICDIIIAGAEDWAAVAGWAVETSG